MAPGARVIGKVALGRESSVWFNAVVRGDAHTIAIGDGSNIQDNAVVHADHGFPTRIGRSVTIGHACIIRSFRPTQ